MSLDTFTIVHDAGTVEYPGSTLLVGVDETGHELFADKRHPVFGLGGCAMLVRHYEEHLDHPWRQMKEHFFGGATTQLHAADLRSPSAEQVQALGHFFTSHPFFRFAAMAASSYANTTQAPLTQLLGHTVWEHVAEVAKWTQPTEVVVVIEDSERLRRELYGYIAGYEIGNETIRIKPRVFLAKKSAKQSFMEVADFVIQAAGAQVRNRVLSKLNLLNPIRQDFAAVFHKVDRKLAHYVELLEARAGAQQSVP